MRLSFSYFALALVSIVWQASTAAADPIEGRDVLKFSQQPMLATTLTGPDGTTEVFNGHDELSTAWSFYNQITPGGEPIFAGYRGQFMADDFADRADSPVVHLKWWGSYLRRPTDPVLDGVKQFLISFEEDIPADATNSFSRPGDPLLNQVVRLDDDGILTPGSGTFTERIVQPTSFDGPIYEYNAELHMGKEFLQEPDKVYWLKIVALVNIAPDVDPLDPNSNVIHWGWHNRDYTISDPLASVPPNVVPGERVVGFLPSGVGDIPIWHFQDDAVDGFVQVTPSDMGGLKMPNVLQDVGGPQSYLPPYDGPSLIAQFSKDLAFELYTVPEPSTLMLGMLALVGSAGMVRNRLRVARRCADADCAAPDGHGHDHHE